MAKPIISNTILAIVATGVLFFIGKSVYDVFTRAHVKGMENSPMQNSTQSGPTVSGTIQPPELTQPVPTENPTTLPAESSKDPLNQNQAAEANVQEPGVNVTAPEPQIPTIDTPPVAEPEAIPETTEEPHALKLNPDLKQAIPPVPLAPPSPFPTPAAPASSEQLFEATDSLQDNTSGAAINNSFPAPLSNFPAPGAAPAITPEPPPFEIDEGSPFNNFPAPINSGNPNPGNINTVNPEFDQLQNLRQQKERLRNDLGF